MSSDSTSKGSAPVRIWVGDDQPEGFTHSFNGTPDQAHKLIRQLPEDALRPWLRRMPDDRGEQEGYCPLHETPFESTPSASFNFDKDVWCCYSNPDCPSGPLGELIWRIGHEDRTPPDPGKLLPPSETAELPSEDTVTGWHSRLMGPDGEVARTYLEQSRGLTTETLERFGIGWNGRSIVFSIRDAEGNIISRRTREPGPDRKVITGKGHPGKVAYPLPEFIEAVEDDPDAILFICEGELDALVLWEHGFPALTTTGGAGALADVVAEHRDLFEGRTVVIWTDHDGPGADARTAVEDVLDGVADRLLLPVPDEPEQGQDVTDVYREHGWRFGEAVDRLVRQGLEAEGGSSGYLLLSEVEPEEVRWLWPGRIPLAKLSMLDGDPERAKSVLTLDLAARVSSGAAMPDGTPGLPEPGGVILTCAEDDVADTIVPRLLAHGADRRRIATIKLRRDDDGEVTPLTFPEDLARLRAVAGDLERRGIAPRLIVIDPITAYLSESINSHNDASVRRATTPLTEVAQDLGAAVLMVRHLNKSGELKAMYRGGGSIAFSGAARSVLVVDEHPHVAGQLVLARIKNNLAMPVPSISYRVTTAADYDVPKIEWGGVVDLDADDLLRGKDARLDAPERDAAEAFLREMLADGPMPQKKLEKEAKGAGLTWRTVRRAQKQIGVEAKRIRDDKGRTKHWEWYLPQPFTEDDVTVKYHVRSRKHRGQR